MRDNEIGEILTQGASSLDITPSMFKQATDHYEAVGKFLENQGLEVEVSPFGSIVTGTVVRPYSEDENAYFDIDGLINRPALNKKTSTPSEARGPVDKALLNSKRYDGMVEEHNECTTIEYVDNGIEGGFRLDLNICVDDSTYINALSCGMCSSYAENAVALAWNSPEEWHDSNPYGLCQWFIDKNERFAVTGRRQRKTRILKESKGVFASIEDIPDSLDRSEMQRAVQVLKRSRDEFFYRRKKTEKGPASCIISVMVGNASEKLPDDATVVDFLGAFIQYAQSIMTSRILRNPVFDEDLLQAWDNENFALLASWTKEIERSLDDLRHGTRDKRAAAIGAIFGRKIGEKVLSAVTAVSTPSIVTPSKPWAL